MQGTGNFLKILTYFLVGMLCSLTSLGLFAGEQGQAENTSTALGIRIDSLKKVIETAEHDTIKVKALLQWDNLIYIANPELDLELNQRILSLCEINLEKELSDQEKMFFTSRLASSYNNIGIIYDDQSDYPRALDYYFKALKIYEELGNKADYAKASSAKQGMAASYNNIGVIYKNQSDYPRALDYYFKVLKIYEELGNKADYAKASSAKQGMAASYNNIGV
ncbi:MAG: hypothetical protein COC01_09230, partial [Bacteroidetes bacterium]